MPALRNATTTILQDLIMQARADSTFLLCNYQSTQPIKKLNDNHQALQLVSLTNNSKHENSPRTRKHFRNDPQTEEAKRNSYCSSNCSSFCSPNCSLILLIETFPHSVLQNDHQNASLKRNYKRNFLILERIPKMFLEKDHSKTLNKLLPKWLPKKDH